MAAPDTRLYEALCDLAQDVLAGVGLDDLEGRAAAVRDASAGDTEIEVRLAMFMTLAEQHAQADVELRQNQYRLAEAQRVGAIGSYDWHIATDTNTWSDELFRIYGCEPGSFNASYEKFMEFVHPEDRDRVRAAHEHAYQTGDPYHIEERIIRPDGEVRVLDSSGEVAMDADGNPVRMFGICRDITEQRRAEEAARRHGERFESLVECSPDALLVVNRDGMIVQVNHRASETFGYESHDLIGQPMELLLPRELVGAHQAHRTAFFDTPRRRPMGTGLEVTARHRDGTVIPVDVSLGVLDTDEGMVVAAFVRDITERRRTEEIQRRLHDANVRRRHALEINDNVVQGLSAALYAFEEGLAEEAMAALRSTVVSARLMMNDLLASADAHDLEAGELARAHPAAAMLPEVPDVAEHESVPTPRRVLLVDDARDIRVILRRIFKAAGGYRVVGEGCNGREAVALAGELQPDVVVLDLAMPVMDGLEALPLIRALLPHATIVVLSGFDGARMRQPALLAGADAYIEKGGNLASVLASIEDLVSHVV